MDLWIQGKWYPVGAWHWSFQGWEEWLSCWRIIRVLARNGLCWTPLDSLPLDKSVEAVPLSSPHHTTTLETQGWDLKCGTEMYGAQTQEAVNQYYWVEVSCFPRESSPLTPTAQTQEAVTGEMKIPKSRETEEWSPVTDFQFPPWIWLTLNVHCCAAQPTHLTFSPVFHYHVLEEVTLGLRLTQECGTTRVEDRAGLST